MTPIFQTKNVALATTLATCGIPFDAHPHNGRPMPFVNFYDVEVLRSFTLSTIADRRIVQVPRYKGWKPEDAALDAWQRGFPGHVIYCFQKVEPFAEVVQAFNRHAEAIANADEKAGAAGQQNLAELPVAPAIAAVICCQFAKNRKALLEGWRTATPWLYLPGAVTTETEGGRTYKVGSMKLYTLGACAETKTKIGL